MAREAGLPLIFLRIERFIGLLCGVIAPRL